MISQSKSFMRKDIRKVGRSVPVYNINNVEVYHQNSPNLNHAVTILHVGNQKMLTEKRNYEKLAIILLILATGS